MSESVEDVNIKQIISFCTVFPDSCTILNFVFDEEEFKPKIDYFRRVVSSGVSCELLPKVSAEILNKLTITVREFVGILRKCLAYCQQLSKKNLEKIAVTKTKAELLEQAFSKVFVDLRQKGYPSPEIRALTIRRARIVETSVMEEFAQILEKKESLSLKMIFDRIEMALGARYGEFCKKQSQFMAELKVNSLEENDLFEVENDLNKLFLQSCNVHNPHDRELLCQAFSRMYKTDTWSAVVTTDYSDIVRNRMAIDFKTQLIVSDPLYFAYRLEKKIDFSLHPQNGALKAGVNWRRFIKNPPNIGVV
jgi:hypothetical protein